MKSWKTTLFGAGGLLTVIVTALCAMFDDNPATNPDWALVLAAASPCIGLLFARDNKVSSEAAGAK